jgi:uncharacterized protein YlxW (UPF0749 family)
MLRQKAQMHGIVFFQVKIQEIPLFLEISNWRVDQPPTIKVIGNPKGLD